MIYRIIQRFTIFALKNFFPRLSAAKEPALAQQAQAAFMDMPQQVLGLAPAEQKTSVRKQLGDLYKRLESQSHAGDEVGARAVLADIQAMQTVHFAVGMVQDALMEISKDTARYVKEPNRYFEAKEGFVRELEAGRGY